VPGAALDAATAALYRRIQPGGFILFGRNIESPSQLRKLVDDLRDLSDAEPVITVDQEGGRVSRLKLVGSEPPSARQLRDKGDLSLIRCHGELTASALRIFGFNLDLCPVLDISFDDEADNSLRGRCYGRTAAEVIEKAAPFNDALRAGGIASCGKHFPGYTCAGLDPHHELPVVERDRATLEANELAVFHHFAPALDSMMMGHITISGIERDGPPASLSRHVVTDFLRGELAFGDKLVMTDDLDMGAILNHYGFDETMRMGLRAGNDLLMICHRVEMVAQAVEAVKSVETSVLDASLARVAAFKERLAPPTEFSEEAFRAIDAQIYKLREDTLGIEAAKHRSPEDGKRSPVEIY